MRVAGDKTMNTQATSLPEILPALHALSRADKLRVIQHLVVDLAQDEGVPLFEAGASYPVWTPLEAYDAVAPLLEMLQ
jgi:hypothetical protein